VRPRLPLPVDRLNSTLAVQPPALIKGYLRLGAKVMGPPAWATHPCRRHGDDACVDDSQHREHGRTQ